MKNLLVKNSLVTRKNIKEKNFVLAVIKSDISDFIRGKFETLGSNFSHEIRITKLLASLLATKFFSLIIIYGSLKILLDHLD